MATEFVPGLRLAREFYAGAVRPLLEGQFPHLPYAAALLGPGSEVAGFDSQRSADHNWGPRLQIFLPDDHAGQAGHVTETLTRCLPASFRGYPVAFPVTWDPGGALRHRVDVTSLGPWTTEQLGFDPRRAVTPLDWLATPAQRLAEFTSGEIFHDGTGELSSARTALRGIRMTSGCMCWPASGSGSGRKRRSPAGAPRPATTWARPWWPDGWLAT